MLSWRAGEGKRGQIVGPDEEMQGGCPVRLEAAGGGRAEEAGGQRRVLWPAGGLNRHHGTS